MSFENKYTNGKLIESKTLLSDGSSWMRTVYTYSDNQVNETIYGDEGKVNQKIHAILDKDGNEIERTDFAVLDLEKDVGDRKYEIKYDSYDAEGNWTKRTTSLLVSEGVRQVYKPLYAEYRAITYYP
jgi:hypothetical protein